MTFSGLTLAIFLALFVRIIYDLFGLFKHYDHISAVLLKEKLPPLPWSPFGSSFHVVTVFKAKEDQSPFLEELVEDLCQAIVKAGGQVVYTGKAVETLVQSKQFPDCQYDILLNTHWKNVGAFKEFLPKMKALAEVTRSQGFYRNGFLNYFGLRMFMALMQLKNVFEGTQNYSVEERVTTDTKNLFEKTPQMLELATKVERGEDPNEPIIVYNWLQDSSVPKDVAADSAYGLKMMTMLAGYFAGPMHLGLKTVAVQPIAEAGEFQKTVAVHYPNREFFAKMLRSAWMNREAQGKKPGDSLAVLTVPFGDKIAGRDEWKRQHEPSKKAK
jgi:hypothetical protein